MDAIEEQLISKQGYNLHVIQSKKYKTVNVIVKLKAPLERSTITKRALLPYIMQQGTNKFPSARKLRTALDDLYGAVLGVDGAKKGENHIITLRLETANEAYLSSEEQILERAVEMLSSILFDPRSMNDGFDPKVVKREKYTLQQKIDSIIDDKMSYANMRLIDEMCPEEPYRLHVHGYSEDLPEIDEFSLYEYFQKLLIEDQMDVYVLGDFEGKDVEKLIETHFSAKSESETEQVDKADIVHQPVNEVRTITEEQNVQQAKLHLGYRTNTSFNEPGYFALQVFNGIFGGFPSSKLFMNVREKHSLAYYAASRFESHKGLLLVFSGIAPKDYQQAKDIINEQMALMKQGDFSDEQLNDTKDLVVNQLLETMDHPQGLIEILYHQALSGKKITPAQMIEKVKQVTRQDVLDVGQKIELDTVYFLTSKGGSGHE
ncbi:EF-P 5-aminopentanol modification-associated protein YfmF [Sediminibacillus albus]|uniref:Predicted Zn-dependent peptidase n=1 Tax=Sediminibacillus albus TaxID=407036 RepID=A0A1G8VYL8_9BACI|nr:pitrilysin family protein [Sediminibacillus albus]SDJ71208.1 Predicted Zn-dependent peptidase [Sediminibacillus albus]